MRFKYLDKVVISNGFYSGQSGEVIDEMWQPRVFQKGHYIYRVRVDILPIPSWFAESQLELVK